jgi:hypothetical protein
MIFVRMMHIFTPCIHTYMHMHIHAHAHIHTSSASHTQKCAYTNTQQNNTLKYSILVKIVCALTSSIVNFRLPSFSTSLNGSISFFEMFDRFLSSSAAASPPALDDSRGTLASCDSGDVLCASWVSLRDTVVLPRDERTMPLECPKSVLSGGRCSAKLCTVNHIESLMIVYIHHSFQHVLRSVSC